MMKSSKIKYLFVIIIFIMLSLGIGILYKTNYEYSTSPPSKKWSKELLLTEASLNEKIKVIKLEKDYAIALNEDDNIKVIIIDEEGKIKKENSFKTKGGIILDEQLIYSKNDLFLGYLENLEGNVYYQELKLSEDLQCLETTKEDEVKSINQCNSELTIKVLKDKTVIKQVEDGKTFVLPIVPEMISSIKYKDKHIIAYYLKNKLNYVEIKDGKMSGPIEMGPLQAKDQCILKSLSVNTDGKNIYCLIDSDAQGSYGMGLLFKYSLQDKKSEVEIFATGVRELSIINPIGINVENDAKFIFATPRNLKGLMSPEYDILEVSIKDGCVKNPNFISKTEVSSYSPAIAGNIVVFKDAKGISDKNQKIYLSTCDEKLKNKLDYVRDYEKKSALDLTASFFIKGEINAVIQSLFWTLPALMFISLISIVLVDGHKEKKIKKLFIIGYLGMIVIKIIKLNEIIYKEASSMMPYFLQNSIIGLGIMLLISLIALGYGYILYSENTERIPIGPFVIGMVIDVLITSVFYAPYVL